MKKIFISFLLSIVALAGCAQEYKPLLVDGRMWEVIHDSYDWFSPYTDEYTPCIETYTVVGDTLVAEKMYKKIVVTGTRHADFLVLAREENKRIYKYYAEALESYYVGNELNVNILHDVDALIMDFNLQESGPTYIGQAMRDVVLDKIDIKGVTYNSTYFVKPSKCTWVEGIGMSSDEIPTDKYGVIANDMGRTFKACYDNGVCIFTAEDFNTTPLGIHEHIVTTNNHKIYNIAGQQVTTLRKGNTYIQNGKKFIAK